MAAVKESGVGSTTAASGGDSLLKQGGEWLLKTVKDNPLAAATALGAAIFTGGTGAPPDDVEKWTDAERGAYEQWLTIEDKHSPEAQDLVLQWRGQQKYSIKQLAAITGIDEAAAIEFYGQFYPQYADESVDAEDASDALLWEARGGEVVGRGTGTSDSIPARLSDGEFVMTAQAVRNAGGGDRNLGAARMYDMMNRFEHGRA
jgi:hypothetical protein